MSTQRKLATITIADPEGNGDQITLLRNRKSSQPVIYTKFDDLGLETPITTLAKEIYEQLQLKATRRNPQLQVMFYCIYEAYKNLGITIDPYNLAKIVGLPPNGITKALSINVKCVNTSITIGDEMSNHARNFIDDESERKFGFSAGDFIKYYYQYTQLNPVLLPNIQNLCDSLFSKNRDFEDNPPQHVAVAVIWYYMEINGVDLNIDQFLEQTNLKKTKITPLYKEVQEIDNS